MGVGEARAGGDVGVGHGRSQDELLEGRGLGALVEEARAEDDPHVALPDAVDHDLDVVDLVLPVGVVGDDVAHRRVAEGELEAGLQGRALAEVDGVAHDGGPGLLGPVGRVVARAVVDAHDLREDGAGLAHDVGDDGGLVVERHHQPHVLVLHASSVERSRTARPPRHTSAGRHATRSRSAPDGTRRELESEDHDGRVVAGLPVAGPPAAGGPGAARHLEASAGPDDSTGRPRSASPSSARPTRTRAASPRTRRCSRTTSRTPATT